MTTPILEYDAVFERSLGQDSDVVSKELYAFVDKSGDRVIMRPEGTAGKQKTPAGGASASYLTRRKRLG
jgi:histidyl-tRNA synthetase